MCKRVSGLICLISDNAAGELIYNYIEIGFVIFFLVCFYLCKGEWEGGDELKKYFYEVRITYFSTFFSDEIAGV